MDSLRVRRDQCHPGRRPASDVSWQKHGRDSDEALALCQEVRSDDPRVRTCPEAFVPLGTPLHEWPQPPRGAY
jgi:hypothetical protein